MPDNNSEKTSRTPERLLTYDAPLLLEEDKPTRLGKLKIRVKAVGQKVGAVRQTVVEKYTPKAAASKRFLKKYRPYLDKAVLMVAVAAASEVLNDREKMEAVYRWVLKLVPSSIRLFLPEKLLFNAIWFVKDDLMKKIHEYREKLASFEEDEDEIQRLIDGADQVLQENRWEKK
ncbi:hypothetical protein AD933_01110 [Acetobacter malorum]|uniref:Uncharacterized protein n=1 Tax=Acetobacter malorum TaxID=178901 RepID=A0A149S1U5_9PROT|nr:hypothetical protein [Acetobacter malorum]KXV20699.1 hypothetical protein AD933_01110 [Acetobacter malorum]